MTPGLRAVFGLVFAAALCVAGVAARAQGLETVAELQRVPGNLAVTANGDAVITLHPFFRPKTKLLRLTRDGRVRPSPIEQALDLGPVLGVQATHDGRIYLLETGRGIDRPPRLIVWNANDGALEQTIEITPPAITDRPFLNDLAVDTARRAVFIADVAGNQDSAIIVVDLETGKARRVLEGNGSVAPEPGTPMTKDGRTLRLTQPDGTEVPANVGLNPITIDPTGTWVYFGAMTSRSLYRARPGDLLDANLTTAELAGKVERYGDKPVSDGITVDGSGNVYVTDVLNDAVGVTRPNGRYEILYRDPARLAWPGALSFGPDDRVWAVASQLHRAPLLNGGEDATQPPFLVLRFPALANGAVGR